MPLTLGGPACRTLPALPLSWLFLPVAGTSYSSTCSNFTATFQVPSRSQHCLVKQMPWLVSSLLPPPLSQPSFLLPWTALKLSTPPTEVPFFFLISFSLKARLSYHQNHSQMTGFNGLTRHVSNYLLGDKSETAWLKWKCTFAQVRRAPTGCGHVFMRLSALPPMPSAVRSHVPVPFVHLPQNLVRGLIPNRQVLSVHKDGQCNRNMHTH